MGARSLILVVVALAGCERTSTKYCALHGASDPQHCGELDAAPDVAMACTGDPECAPGRCNASTMQCVQCLEASDCPSATPFCDPQTLTCGACRVNADCASSGACLPDGQCADAADVIYADAGSGSDTNPCTQQQPCQTIGHALEQVTATKSALKLTGAFSEAVVFSSVSVTLLADPGTSLAVASGNAPALGFTGTGSVVSVYDLEIASTSKSAANVSTGNKLTLSRMKIHDCGDVAIVAAGTLSLSQSAIYSNVAGGVSLANNASFQISNNVIHHNGSDSTAFGGVSIGTTGQSSFEFNTVVDNDANTSGANAGGIACTANGFHAPNNVIARNALKGNTTATSANVVPTGPCDFSASHIQTDVSGLAFVNPDAAAASDYHIGSASSAKDASTVPSLISEDIDGQSRPEGSAKDLGADEYHP
jgi:hypothetical protein